MSTNFTRSLIGCEFPQNEYPNIHDDKRWLSDKLAFHVLYCMCCMYNAECVLTTLERYVQTLTH